MTDRVLDIFVGKTERPHPGGMWWSRLEMGSSMCPRWHEDGSDESELCMYASDTEDVKLTTDGFPEPCRYLDGVGVDGQGRHVAHCRYVIARCHFCHDQKHRDAAYLSRWGRYPNSSAWVCKGCLEHVGNKIDLAKLDALATAEAEVYLYEVGLDVPIISRVRHYRPGVYAMETAGAGPTPPRVHTFKMADVISVGKTSNNEVMILVEDVAVECL